MEEHSVNLLRECDSGCKMAAESLEQIRDFCISRIPCVMHWSQVST